MPSSFPRRAPRSPSPGAAPSISRMAPRSVGTWCSTPWSARSSIRPRSKTCSWAAPIPKAPPASTSRARSRCAPDVPVTTSGMTVNRYCSSGLQTIALAAQRIIAGEGEVYVAGGVESISCVQNERLNLFMAKESWLDEHKPAIYWNMLQTAETVAQPLPDSARGAGSLRRAEPAACRGGAGRRPVHRRDRAHRGRHGCGGPRHRPAHDAQGDGGARTKAFAPTLTTRRCRRFAPRRRAA